MSVDINKGAAGIAGIDRRVGLDKCTCYCLITDLSVDGTDDSGRNRLTVAKCVSDCNNIFSDLEIVGIAECGNSDHALCRFLEIVERDSDHREVVAGIRSLELRVACLLVDKQDSEIIRAFNHVIICHNEKLCVCLTDNNTGTRGFSLSCKCLAVEILHFFSEIIIYRHDGGHNLVYHLGEPRIRGRRIGDDQPGFILKCLRTCC